MAFTSRSTEPPKRSRVRFTASSTACGVLASSAMPSAPGTVASNFEIVSSLSATPATCQPRSARCSPMAPPRLRAPRIRAVRGTIGTLAGAMPELPEVEITARRIDRAVKGATVESAFAPGMVTMKTFDPPIDSLAGRTITGVSRRGKMPVVEFDEELALLIHLMSAGRLQLFDKRASLRDKASRILIRLPDEHELRLREFGTQQRAWAKLLPLPDVDADEAVAPLGPEAYPVPPIEELAERIRRPRHLHPLLRDQRTIAGIGRSWVDEILWTARLSPFRQGDDLDDEALEDLHGAID